MIPINFYFFSWTIVLWFLSDRTLF